MTRQLRLSGESLQNYVVNRTKASELRRHYLKRVVFVHVDVMDGKRRLGQFSCGSQFPFLRESQLLMVAADTWRSCFNGCFAAENKGKNTMIAISNRAI